MLITNSTQLTIQSVSLLDGGVYTCEAINSVGKDSVQYKLEVFCKLRISTALIEVILVTRIKFPYKNVCFPGIC